jgi:hypothetical protein
MASRLHATEDLKDIGVAISLYDSIFNFSQLPGRGECPHIGSTKTAPTDHGENWEPPFQNPVAFAMVECFA